MSTMPTTTSPKAIHHKGRSGAASSVPAVHSTVETDSLFDKSKATESNSCIAFRKLATCIPPGNRYKFGSPARLASRLVVKIRKCFESETGCYILISGVSASMINPIDDAFVNYGIRGQVRFTYEYVLDSMIIKCMPSILHERVSRSFIEKVTAKICAIPEHSNYSYHHTGSGQFSASGQRSKQGDEGLAPSGTRDGVDDWPSLVVEVGYSQHLISLQQDAYWWLENSGGQTRMVILIKITKDPISLHLECWEEIDDENRPSTRSCQPKIPGFKQYFDINASGNVTHHKDYPDLVIPYRTVFDVDHNHASDLIISQVELSSWALHIFKGFTPR